MAVQLFGIRHHGPGLARQLLLALEQLRPSVILIEGPPEGESILKWAADEAMQPPVALLAYVPDEPQKAVFYPFAAFSPEWQAIQYGLKNKVPIRFIDMPLVHKLAGKVETEGEGLETEAESAGEGLEDTDEDTAEMIEDIEAYFRIRRQPLSYLAEAAGFEDSEEWWAHQFELRQSTTDVFEAVEEAITALRESFPPTDDPVELQREAFMRRGIRQAEKDMYADIAVICGAWHVPALRTMPSQKSDDDLLKGLPKTKIETTWIPWTSDRLAFESGYGAGMDSPGWFLHNWNAPQDNGSIWLSHVAATFRKHKIDVSSAHVIEALRLSHALAALRDRHRPALSEFNEATQTVMCMGSDIPMQIVYRDLIVGNEMGTVPEGTPQVPLHRDFESRTKQLRLKIHNEDKNISLDLREDAGREKSILLNRLNLLDIPWGRKHWVNSKGTFKEEWVICWSPQMTIGLIEKAPWGNTVEFAANSYLAHLAATITDLAGITQLATKALPADLHAGIQKVIQRMDTLASSTHDTSALMTAFVPLAELSKYGNVRGTDSETIAVILDSIFYRILAALPLSCTGLDEDAAAVMQGHLRAVHKAIGLLDLEEMREAWVQTLAKIPNIQNAAALLQGTACKMLYDLGYLSEEATGIAFSKALSQGNAPADSAAWLEGFLDGAAELLLLDEVIWAIADEWLQSLDAEVFLEIIPLLRRTFGNYQPAERRKIAEKVKQGKVAGTKAAFVSEGFNTERAASILPIFKQLLGLGDQQ